MVILFLGTLTADAPASISIYPEENSAVQHIHTAINYSATVNIEKHAWINDYMKTWVYIFTSAQQQQQQQHYKATVYDAVVVPSC